jgi:hypothetical protein
MTEEVVSSNNIKRADKINNNYISLKGITFNKDNKCLYVTDRLKLCIYMLDSNLNFIKSFGTHGKGNNHFNQPLGLCCKGDMLYICDYGNKRVQILSCNLEHIDSMQLDYWPESIKISDSTICISGHQEINFYDLETRTLKEHFSNVYGRLSRKDSRFYVRNNGSDKKIHCFGEDKDTSIIRNLRISDSYKEWDYYWWDECALFYNFKIENGNFLFRNYCYEIFLH